MTEPYPTEAELEQIEKWPIEDWDGLLAFIEPLWVHYGRFTRTAGRLELATGGWSGNEDVVSSLRKNMFWMMTWESSHRGGLFIFDLEHLRSFPKNKPFHT